MFNKVSKMRDEIYRTETYRSIFKQDSKSKPKPIPRPTPKPSLAQRPIPRTTPKPSPAQRQKPGSGQRPKVYSRPRPKLRLSRLVPSPLREFSKLSKIVRSGIRIDQYHNTERNAENLPVTTKKRYDRQFSKPFVGNIQYFKGDMISYASLLSYEKSNRVCILNMANNSHPGGGYLGGANAQEEQLCSRTNSLFTSLSHKLYPINRPIVDNGTPIAEFYKNALITKGVKIHRDANLKPYTDKHNLDIPDPKIRPVDVISIASVNLSTKPQYSKIQGQILYHVWKTILNIASRRKYTELVVSAIGAGAFGNDPFKCGRELGKVLKSEGGSMNIHVVVLDDTNSNANSVKMLQGLNDSLDLKEKQIINKDVFLTNDFDNITKEMDYRIEEVNKKLTNKVKINRHQLLEPIVESKYPSLLDNLSKLNRYSSYSNRVYTLEIEK